MLQIKKLFLIAFIACIAVQLNAQSYKLPVYEKFKLKNGLTVYLMEQHEVPMINISGEGLLPLDLTQHRPAVQIKDRQILITSQKFREG